MKKMKDERLIIKNLKNIRVAFLVQTIGILAILLYDVITVGFTEATRNPLWFLFIITVVVLSFLNIGVSMDVYDDTKMPKKPFPYYLTVMIIAFIGIAIGLIQLFYSGKISDAIIVGSVIFICFLVPFTYAHYLRKKRSEQLDK
ncbi:hypothetical protein [Oceanobacillus sp. 1P07AA]|uniref:hypothetical protein n=1 Tax=Oceanobacillus sp. 1P07AA TaxID=3132293 RepID=UPI0039A42B1B